MDTFTSSSSLGMIFMCYYLVFPHAYLQKHEQGLKHVDLLVQIRRAHYCNIAFLKIQYVIYTVHASVYVYNLAHFSAKANFKLTINESGLKLDRFGDS